MSAPSSGVRLARESDAASIHAIYAPIVRDTVISFETEVPEVAEIARRIRTTLASLPWLVREEEGRVAGYAYASRHRERRAYQWSVDVSAYVDAAFRRRGIGRALYAALFERLVRQGYFNAYAGITLPNAASVGLHEALGFTPVGVYRGVGFKCGAWHDVGWWHRRLRDLVPNPQPPRGP